MLFIYGDFIGIAFSRVNTYFTITRVVTIIWTFIGIHDSDIWSILIGNSCVRVTILDAELGKISASKEITIWINDMYTSYFNNFDKRRIFFKFVKV